MHSGIGASMAYQIAKAKSLQTVETTISDALEADKGNLYKNTLRKYWVSKEEFCKQGQGHSDEWIEAWDQISKAWAEYAKSVGDNVGSRGS
jgi:hypothetical protein